MKVIVPLFLVAVIACAGDAPSDQSVLPQIIKKRHDHRDANGNVDVYADTFYRGKERILVQATYTTLKPSGVKMWREFMVQGTTVLKEIDYGDAKPRMVCVYHDGSLYDAFRRYPDGSVEPMSSEELTRAKQEQQEFLAGFESVMEKVREGIETNSVEKVMQDLSREVERSKQTQRPGESK